MRTYSHTGLCDPVVIPYLPDALESLKQPKGILYPFRRPLLGEHVACVTYGNGHARKYFTAPCCVLSNIPLASQGIHTDIATSNLGT